MPAKRKRVVHRLVRGEQGSVMMARFWMACGLEFWLSDWSKYLMTTCRDGVTCKLCLRAQGKEAAK